MYMKYEKVILDLLERVTKLEDEVATLSKKLLDGKDLPDAG
ncbi:hypothetical protein AGMMS50289_23390 [Betaproteobacteria bacterium]|nr:hypothetical protein AGMMS50289_23390 [Betaproteobacteria bacterium]